eukprot:3033491-Prymnesium_polylepis.1
MLDYRAGRLHGSRCLSCRAGRLPCHAQPSAVAAGRAAGRVARAPRVQTGCALAKNRTAVVVSCRVVDRPRPCVWRELPCWGRVCSMHITHRDSRGCNMHDASD